MKFIWYPAVREHSTARYYVHEAFLGSVDEWWLLRLYPNEELKLDEQGSKKLISTSTSPKTIIEIPTRAYVDSLSENDRIRRGMSIVFNDMDKQIDKIELTNLDCFTAKRCPLLYEEVSNKKHTDDEFDKNTIFRINPTFHNYLSVSVDNDIPNPTE